MDAADLRSRPGSPPWPDIHHRSRSAALEMAGIPSSTRTDCGRCRVLSGRQGRSGRVRTHPPRIRCAQRTRMPVFAHRHGDRVAGLLLWAAYPGKETDLSAVRLPILSITGSVDELTTAPRSGTLRCSPRATVSAVFGRRTTPARAMRSSAWCRQRVARDHGYRPRQAHHPLGRGDRSRAQGCRRWCGELR